MVYLFVELVNFFNSFAKFAVFQLDNVNLHEVFQSSEQLFDDLVLHINEFGKIQKL